MISIVEKYRNCIARGGDGGSRGSGGGSNQSLNAAMGRGTVAQRNESYGPGWNNDNRRDNSDRSAANDRTAQLLNAQRLEREAQQRASEEAAQRARVQAQQQAAFEAAREKQLKEEAAQRAETQRRQDNAFRFALEQKAQRDALLNNFVSATGQAESGGIFNATNPNSSATGLHQFTSGTWNKMIQTYRPDLLQGRTKQQVLELRTDPELSTEMATNLARENADYLEGRGLPVNEGSLYLSHFLGAGTAANVLRANPDTPINELVGEKAIEANKSILGGDRTASDITSWASNKMFANAPAQGATQASGAPSIRYGYKPGEGQFRTPESETAQQQGGIGGLLGGLFGGQEATNRRIAELEAAGMTSTYPDQSAAYAKQAYADQFAGGDVSKVKSRITDFGQGPVVDYYTKDIGDKFAEATSGLLGGVGKLIGGASEQPYKGAESDRASSIATGSIFGNLFSGTPRADYGPYGNLTAEQYRQQYGGNDGAERQTFAAVDTQPVSPQPVTTPPVPTPEELARDPYLWQQYYNSIPKNYGIQMAQAPLVGPTIRGIFS